MGIMMKTYLYKVQLKHKNEFIRIDIMFIDGQWFWSHHSCFTVMLLEGLPKEFNELQSAQAVAELAGWKLIGEIK